MQGNDDKGNLEQALNGLLNKNGHGFQYAVLKEVQSAITEVKSPWLFEVAEFPVSINGEDIHIDFILQNFHEPFYLICECKRVNPALSNWVFLKAPAISKKITYNTDNIVREMSNERGDGTFLQSRPIYKDKYRLHFEIKSGEIGDCSKGKQLDESITQVMRGLNGFIEYTIFRMKKADFKSVRNNKKIAFLPVIFTTARILTSDVDISESDLLSGKIDVNKIKLEEKEWCYFQYNQSQNLKHNHFVLQSLKDLSDVLSCEFTRTILIVSAKGIRKFLLEPIWNDDHLFVWSRVEIASSLIE